MKAGPEKQAYMRAYNAAHRTQKVAYNRRYREAHLGRLLAADREYHKAHREERAAYQREYRQSEHGRSVRKGHNDRDAVKQRARTALRNAVHLGYVVKGPCAVCGDPTTHGHHHNGYDRAHYRDVVWLCAIHHGEVHRTEAAS